MTSFMNSAGAVLETGLKLVLFLLQIKRFVPLPNKSSKLFKLRKEGRVEGGEEGGVEVAASGTGRYQRIQSIYRLLRMELNSGKGGSFLNALVLEHVVLLNQPQY